MNFVNHNVKDLHYVDLGLIMASHPRCKTSVEDLEQRLPQLNKVLDEESTHFLKWSLISKNLKKWLDVIKISRYVMRGVGGGGRVVADNRGGSRKVVTRASTSEVDSMFRLNKESIPVSGLGLSMFETKPDDTEELCC
ncbi:hypothetical protein Tco_1346385 [Tanacetum coccineum]